MGKNKRGNFGCSVWEAALHIKDRLERESRGRVPATETCTWGDRKGSRSRRRHRVMRRRKGSGNVGALSCMCLVLQVSA